MNFYEKHIKFLVHKIDIMIEFVMRVLVIAIVTYIGLLHNPLTNFQIASFIVIIITVFAIYATKMDELYKKDLDQ